MSESSSKRSKTVSLEEKKGFMKQCNELMKRLQPVALVQMKEVASLQSDFNSEKLTLEEAQEELERIEERFDSGEWRNDPGNKPDALPPMPALAVHPTPTTARKNARAEKPSLDTADVFARAGVDLQEEAALLAPHSATTVARSTTFSQSRAGQDPVFCDRKVVRDILKKTFQAAGLSGKVDPKVEELMCIAVEMRMTEFLKRLASASRASEDVASDFGAATQLDDPLSELQKLAGAEEVEQVKKAKRDREMLEKLAETNSDDVRVRAMLDEQARQRSVADSNQAAINMVRGGGAAKPRGRGRPAKGELALAGLGGPEVRVAQAKRAEGQELTHGESKLLDDYDRRHASVTNGGKKRAAALQRAERRVGVKELMFVMDTDPYFKSVRMQATIKSGFLGRGVQGESRAFLRE